MKTSGYLLINKNRGGCRKGFPNHENKVDSVFILLQKWTGSHDVDSWINRTMKPRVRRFTRVKKRQGFVVHLNSRLWNKISPSLWGNFERQITRVFQTQYAYFVVLFTVNGIFTASKFEEIASSRERVRSKYSIRLLGTSLAVFLPHRIFIIDIMNWKQIVSAR